MLGLKRLGERYLGVPPAGPGEDTAWTFSWTSPWPAGLPAWLTLVIVALGLAGVTWVYLQDSRRLSLGRRAALLGLRLSLLALLLGLLTELALSIDRTGLPVLVVMIDDSASMSLRDRDGTGADGSSPASSGGSTPSGAAVPSGGVERMQRVRDALLRNGGALPKALAARHKLRFYRFSETASPLGRGEYLGAEEIGELLPEIESLRAEGDRTRPGPALKKVLDDLRGTPPAAVVVFTDGISSTGDGDRLSGASSLAKSRLVPVFPVGTGSEEPARDVQLLDALVDEVAFVDDPITFSAKLKGHGFAGRRVQVVLRTKDSPEVLAEKSVRLGNDGQTTKFELIYAPHREGEIDFVLEARPLPEETNPADNAATRHVSVRREKIRVLLADSRPRYEYRYVKHLLEREKSIELQTVLQEADADFATEDRTALPRFPVRREDLFRYDVVILGDVDPGLLGPAVFESLADFVRVRGGGLLLVAGPFHDPLSYRGTPLEPLLPVALDALRVPDPDATVSEGFHPELTIDGRSGSAMFRFADSDEESQQVWRDLPDLYWLAEAHRLRPGAIVLAEHPVRSGEERRLPVVVLQRFGAGKVLMHLTDDLWRWRFRAGDAYYGRYWVQALRYLSRSKLLGQDRTAELTVDRSVYQRGDVVALRVRFVDERLAPEEKDGVTVLVERRGDVRRTVKLSRVPQARNVFEGQLAQLPEGTYHAWVSAPSFQEAPPARDFRVEPPQRELRLRSLDRADLVQTAEATHGTYLPIAEVERLVEELPPGQPVPLETQEPITLWNRPEVLLLFAGLLLAEWILRKRSRLV